MLICFDFDGVIADTFDTLLNICKDSQSSIGTGRPPVASDFRLTENLTFDHLASQLGIPSESINEFAHQVFSRLGTNADTVFPEMIDALRTLAKHHTLCVVTANTVAKVSSTLEAAGIDSCFSSLYGGEEGLPKSEQITRARKEFGVSQGETVMVGDTLGDIRMGKAAGVSSVAVTWGYQGRDFLSKAAPDFFADDPDELVKIINELN